MNILVTKDLRYIYVGNEYVQLPSELDIKSFGYAVI